MDIKKFFTRKAVGRLMVLVLFLLVLRGLYWEQILNVAHSSFENYYNFRGCVALLEKTDMYGICKTSSGTTIKIVKYHNKWILTEDVPR